MRDDEGIQLRSDVRRGVVDDLRFDDLYPAPIRARSNLYWTPVEVARRAAPLFARQNARRVLDIGAGAGKFCLVAACECPDIDFTGVEQRPYLVDAARAAATRLGLENVRFFTGDATDAGWFVFDGFYLYNPFAENIYTRPEHLDHTVELSERRFLSDVRRVTTALAEARVGTCVVTYNGLGGPIPAAYELVHAERAGCDWLRLWVKREPAVRRGSFYLEHDKGVTLIVAESEVAGRSGTPP